MRGNPIAAVAAVLLISSSFPSSSVAQATERATSNHFSFKTSVPAVSGKACDVWIPIPSDSEFQTVTGLQVNSPLDYQINTEAVNGNRMVYIHSDAAKGAFEVNISFDVFRKAGHSFMPAEPPSHRYSERDRLVPIDGRPIAIAGPFINRIGSTSSIVRSMYDHVVATLQYDYKKESPRLGMGDVMFVCDYKKGNCSDLHSYLISLARNAGVPAYIEYGFPITGVPVANPVPLTGKIAGYHCWTWFYDAENGWTPLDASDGRRWLDSNRADIKDTLFGNLIPERSAVAMSRGRDLVLNPPQKGDPVNNFIYPYAEVEGKPVDAKWELNYERILGGSTQDQVSELLKIVRNQQEEIDKLKAASLPAPKAPQNVTTPSSEKITAYGFIRTDAIYDTSAGNPNGQFPQFVKSPDDPAVRGANDQFSLHPRLTRLGFNLVSPADTLPGWNLGGKIEFDFQNGGSESRPTPRARLLYVNMQRGPNGWRIGQDWDLISPLLPSPNDDSLLWNTGNLGDRRPQIRFTHDEPGGSQFAISLGLTGAIDAKDLDGNGVRDGEDSGSPHLQARYGWKNAKSGIGLWGFAGRERTTIPVAGKTNFSSSGFGIDWTHAFSKTADFKGEVWTGKNVSDFRGGIGQGIQTSTGNQVRSTGGWAEIGFFPTPKHRIAFGYGEDNPNDADISANGKTRNRTAYIHNKWTLGTGLELGLNYMYWTTTYKGLSPGIDHRFNLFLTRKF